MLEEFVVRGRFWGGIRFFWMIVGVVFTGDELLFLVIMTNKLIIVDFFYYVEFNFFGYFF